MKPKALTHPWYRRTTAVFLSLSILALSPGLRCYEAFAAALHDQGGGEDLSARRAVIPTQPKVLTQTVGDPTSTNALDTVQEENPALPLDLGDQDDLTRLYLQAHAGQGFLDSVAGLQEAIRSKDSTRAWGEFRKIEASLRSIAQAFPDRGREVKQTIEAHRLALNRLFGENGADSANAELVSAAAVPLPASVPAQPTSSDVSSARTEGEDGTRVGGADKLLNPAKNGSESRRAETPGVAANPPARSSAAIRPSADQEKSGHTQKTRFAFLVRGASAVIGVSGFLFLGILAQGIVGLWMHVDLWTQAASSWLLLAATLGGFLGSQRRVYKAVTASQIGRMGALAAAASIFLATGYYVPAGAVAVALCGLVGMIAAIGLPWMFAKAKAAYDFVKDRWMWMRGFWKRVSDHGIMVKRQLAAAMVLSIATSILYLLAPKLTGSMFKEFMQLSPLMSAAPVHYAIPVLFYLSWTSVAVVAIGAIAVAWWIYSRRLAVARRDGRGIRDRNLAFLGLLLAVPIAVISLMAMDVAPPEMVSGLFQALLGGIPIIILPTIAQFFIMGGAVILVYLTIAPIDNFRMHFGYDVGNRLMAGLSNVFVEHVLKLPLSWHYSHPSGDITSTASNALYSVQSTAAYTLMDLAKYCTLLIPSTIVMIYCSWQMTSTLGPLLFLLLAIPTSLYKDRMGRAYRWLDSSLKPAFMSLLQSIATNIETVKSAGTEAAEMEEVAFSSHRTYRDGGEALAAVNSPYQALSNGLTYAVKILVFLAVGVASSYWGWMTPEQAVLFFFAADYFRQSVDGLNSSLIKLTQAKKSATKLDGILDTVKENYNEGGFVLPQSTNGHDIELDHVSFGYLPGQKVLNDVSMNIRRGQMVALVGETGSGKTTITRLILGLSNPNTGTIRFDGVDLKDINKKDLRPRGGVILQDPVPFSRSIYRNIAYLKPGASEAEIWKAAELAGLHEDIARMGYSHNLLWPKSEDDEFLNQKSGSIMNRAYKKLLGWVMGKPQEDAEIQPDPRLEEERRLVSLVGAKLLAARRLLGGESDKIFPDKSIYDNIGFGTQASHGEIVEAAKKIGLHDDIVRLGYTTKVGERGTNLSGGQKQRLLLARLFVAAEHPWDFMILDEPTAALDGITQQRIQQVLESMRGKTTIIMVAHRLSTIQTADNIVVFDNGKIVEQGNHDQLIDKDGVYSELWKAQRALERAKENSRKIAAATSGVDVNETR